MDPGPCLCLDAATVFPQVGVLCGEEWLCFERREHARAEALWAPLREWFPKFRWAGFIYNAGPGGTLGLHSVLMMVRIWKTLPACRSGPVGHYNGLQIASRLDPAHTLIAQVRQGECWRAKAGEVIPLPSGADDFPADALRFPAQPAAPPALRALEAADYDLRPAAPLLAAALTWDELWREPPASAAFTPWDGQRHGAGGVAADPAPDTSSPSRRRE